MKDTREAYNEWADQYDTNINRTRDLEGKALRECLSPLSFTTCLEVGCGTGKNTVWLAGKCEHITSVDLSEKMLAKAKEKVNSANVTFVQADISRPWTFVTQKYDLVTFSLVLEHLSDLTSVFNNAANALHTNGHVYVGELHPFKQYQGSKARFETGQGLTVVECFNHHVSEFINSARTAGLQVELLREYFDDDNESAIPRILSLVFKKI